MYVKFPLKDLNPGSYPPHLTSIYTCEVTIAPRVCGGTNSINLSNLFFVNLT